MRAGDPAEAPRATLAAVTARPDAPASFRSSSVRPAAPKLIRQGITETLSRRRLIAYLVRADLKKKGTDTLLGNVWWVVDPLLQMLVYVVLVAVILQKSTPDYPLFIFCAILPWKWFQATVTDGTSSVVSQERLIKQIQFPKLVLPSAAVVAGVVNFAFGLIPLFALTALFYSNRLSAWFLLIPVIAAVQFVFSLAVGVGLSAVNVFYRDIGNLARHVLRFWFYLSPALYGPELVNKLTTEHPSIGLFFKLNPWTTFFGAYRDLIYYGTAPDWVALGAWLLVSIGLLALAVLLFKRVEPAFAKVL
jgi:ABC-type polysaccharide/polyol phosphate export permease